MVRTQRAIWTLIRTAAVLVSLALFWACSLAWLPTTARGIHCPTAPVQKVNQVVYVKDCCGKLVPKVVERAPQPGDREFKQCACAERHSAANVESTAEFKGFPPVLLWGDQDPLDLRKRVAVFPRTVHAFLGGHRPGGPDSPPLTPPPQGFFLFA